MNERDKTADEIAKNDMRRNGFENGTEGAESQRSSGEVSFDRSKIDQALDHFLQEQEREAERKKQQELRLEKQKRNRRRAKTISAIGLIVFVLLIILLNPETIKQYQRYADQQAPREEYTIEYNYSVDMELAPMGEGIVLYDSGNIRYLKKDGAEIFSIAFRLADWDMATSDDRIYLMDRINKLLYFIDDKGTFVAKVELPHIPSKLYAGKAGNLVVHYRSDASVEGVLFFDRDGKLLEDLNYPKTTLTVIDVNAQNQITVHGMYRMNDHLTNSVYRYSANGKLIFSKEFEDVLIVRQYENAQSLAFIDPNTILFYDKTTNELIDSVNSNVSAKLLAYDELNEQIYVLDKRNKLHIYDMTGRLVDEKHFQSEYEQMVVYKGKLVLLGEDFIRIDDREIKYPKKPEGYFKVGDYLGFVMKGEIRLMNKME